MADTLINVDNRLTALDGVGAQVPSSASVPTIFRSINGLTTTISQLTLTIQSQMNTVAAAVATLQASVNNLLGIGGGNAAARLAFVTTGTTGTVTVLFPVQFADNNYTVTVSIEPAVSTFPATVSIAGFVKRTDFAGVTVMYTATGASLNATAHVIARHD